MWKFLQRLTSRRARGSANSRQPNRVRLRLETLEDRLTPAAFNAFVQNSVLNINKIGNGDSDLTLVKASGFQEFTVATNGADLINGNTSFTTIVPISSIVFRLNSGIDSLLVDGTATNGVINLPTGLGIFGVSGDKNLTIKSANLRNNTAVAGTNALNIAVGGTGNLTTTITDVNTTGPSSMIHTGTGGTLFTMNTSASNKTKTNSWGSLKITNGSGSDSTSIFDTDFTGSVVVSNGFGQAGNTSQFGGSHTVMSAQNNNGMLTVGGGVTITTLSGQSDSEVFDYIVRGTVAITSGSGISGQAAPNFIGLENHANGNGLPILGGVALTGTAVKNVNPAGLVVQVGIDNVGNDFPLQVLGNFALTVNGTGSADVTLNDLNVTGTSTVTLTSSTNNNNVTVQADSQLSRYGSMTIASSATGVNTIDVQTINGNLEFTGNLTVKLGSGVDTVNVGDISSNGKVRVTGTLGFTGTGGAKTINVENDLLGALSMVLSGTGAENTTFTDVNVIGTAKVSHSVGDTNFTITTSGSNSNHLNTWGSLTITNGTGSDSTLIEDTDFSGSISIANGFGAPNNTNQFGGSQTVLQSNHNTGLLTVVGGVTVTTVSGQSDTQIHDYHVRGVVAISTGPGIANQIVSNFVGIENKVTHAGAGVPILGGVIVSAGGPNTLSTAAVVDIGTDPGNGNHPLTIWGGLAVTAVTGAVDATLNDLIVTGTTTLTMNALSHNNNFTVQGSTITSMYNTFNVNAIASGNNFLNLQDQKGNLQFTGPVKVIFGNGNDTVNLAADSSNTTGISNAVVEFFSTAFFNGGLGGTDFFFQGILGVNVFFVFVPTIINF